MAEKKDEALFAKAIDYCARATQGGNMLVNLALGLKLFVQGMSGRQPQPPSSLFRMAIDHCERAATPNKLAEQLRLAQLATALQQFIAAMK